MFVHSFFCCSVLGAFFCYLLIDLFLSESHDKESLTDTTVLLLLSLPYLVIFAIGCHSMYLTNMIYDEIKFREEESESHDNYYYNRRRNNSPSFQDEERKEVSIPKLKLEKELDEVELLDINHAYPDSKVCVICYEVPKNTIFYPCGHECVCFDCGQNFLR